MRILIGHNFYQNPGGEDMVARSEAELLRSFGEDVIEYHRHNDEFNRLWPGAQISRLARVGFSLKSYREISALIRDKRPQIAHFHNIYYMMTPAVYKACHDQGVPVVQSLHNFRMMCSNALLYRDGHVCEDCVKKNLWEGVRHRCFRGSAFATAIIASGLDRLWRKGIWLKDVDRYIAAAEFTRNKYIDRGIPVHKIVVKPHFLHPDPGRRQKIGGYALYVGRLSGEKGVMTLLEAWQSLGTIPLKIIGTGPLENELKRLVECHKMSQVEILGYMEQSKCQNLIAEAKMVVVPSVCYENFPRVVVEAFASGVPVVASRLGSLAELVDDSKMGLLVNPGDASDLARAVRWCFENTLQTSQMGENARKVFEQRYSARANYEQLMQIYRSVIHETSRTDR